MEYLRLVEPSLEYKEAGIDYINEHYRYGSKINGCGGLDRYLNNYEEWLKKLEEDRNNPSKSINLLPYSSRRQSNNWYDKHQTRTKRKTTKKWGHIGYGIRPTERRKGYNKINLYLALEICKQHGLEEVLLDCEKSNLGSSRTMQALGGDLESEYIDEDDLLCQRYKINVSNSLKEYYNLYNQDKTLKKI